MLKRGIRWVPALLVASAALPTAVRLFGDHDRAWLIMIVTFLPLAAAALGVLALVAAMLRRWRTVGVTLALVALNVVWLAPRYVADSPPAGTELTAMTVNLQYGWTNPAVVVEQVRERDVDVLGVTELTPEAVTELDAAGLDDLLPHRHLTPGPQAHGSGLWSRHPLAPGPSWDGVHAMPGATVAFGGRDIHVQVAHPFRTGRYSAADYRADYRMLDERMSALPAGTPAIVLGDFNASLDHAAFRRLLGDRWRDAAEYAGSGFSPTWSPRYWIPYLVALDHVLVSRHFGAHDSETFELPGSDHAGLAARLVLAPPAP